jgi:hypothetical protein
MPSPQITMDEAKCKPTFLKKMKGGKEQKYRDYNF